MDIKELKAKIQSLINQNDKDYKKVKDLYTFLYKKKEEVKEIEAMERLREYAGGKYFNAYLIFKSIVRANFQTEYLKLTNYKELQQYLEVVNSDIEANFREEPNSEQPTNEELLRILGERLATGEIKSNYSDEGDYEGCDRLDRKSTRLNS